MPVRLKDIARELGVSTVTVSKVLRGNADVGAETRARVLERMRAYNYRPNIAARGLAHGKTFTVGLVVPALLQPFFAEFAKELAGVLRANDRALLLASSEEDGEVEQQEIRTMVQRGVDVLLLASCRDGIHSMPELGKDPVPLVLFDRQLHHLKANFVGSDDRKAGELATEHLFQIGRKRIAHIGGLQISPSVDRALGYRNALEKHGVPFVERYFILHERLEQRGYDVGFSIMRELLALAIPPDAAFCYNDLTAVGAIEAVLQVGLRVPQDVSVVGCGNFRYADHLRVPLSSIDQGTAELGRAAGRLALVAADKTGVPTQSIVLQPRLVVRASSVQGARP